MADLTEVWDFRAPELPSTWVGFYVTIIFFSLRDWFRIVQIESFSQIFFRVKCCVGVPLEEAGIEVEAEGVHHC